MFARAFGERRKGLEELMRVLGCEQAGLASAYPESVGNHLHNGNVAGKPPDVRQYRFASTLQQTGQQQKDPDDPIRLQVKHGTATSAPHLR
jgi:hypothetical protein